jgi:hypothetical protein
MLVVIGGKTLRAKNHPGFLPPGWVDERRSCDFRSIVRTNSCCLIREFMVAEMP